VAIFNKRLFDQRVSFAGWAARLPRGIMPTDIDWAVDDNGRFIFAEYKSNACTWSKVPVAQRLFFTRLVALGKGQIVAAVVQHHPAEGDDIDSVVVEAFSLLRQTPMGVQPSKVYDGRLWAPYVTRWFGQRPRTVPDKRWLYGLMA
jgi:hypothetical protein